MLIDRLRYAGGAEVLVTGLATHLPPERFEVTVCTTREAKGRLLGTLESAGVRHLNLGRRTRFDLPAFRPLVSFMRRAKPDVLHSHKLGANVWGALLGRMLRVPVIVAHEHGSSYEGNPERRLLNRRVVGGLADAVVAGSAADRESLVAKDGIPAEKVAVLPGGYVPRVGRTRRDLRQELGVSDEVPVIGTVAVLRREKALDVLIDGFARVLPSFPDAWLVICGNGPCRGALERHARNLGLGDRVRFLGFRDDIDAVLNRLDIAVISSDREGTSLFALECMVHGTPLVATDVGGLRDNFEDGVNALLVPPRKPEALATALATLLADPVRREALASAARRRADEFTIERAAARFADLYERLFATSVRGPSATTG